MTWVHTYIITMTYLYEQNSNSNLNTNTKSKTCTRTQTQTQNSNTNTKPKHINHTTWISNIKHSMHINQRYNYSSLTKSLISNYQSSYYTYYIESITWSFWDDVCRWRRVVHIVPHVNSLEYCMYNFMKKIYNFNTVISKQIIDYIMHTLL